MQCQRRILAIQWSDFVTNSTVTEKTGLPDIHAVINDRKVALFGHFRRLPEGTPAHDVFMRRLKHMPASYHILVGKESQEDHNTYLVTWCSESNRFNCSGGLDSGRSRERNGPPPTTHFDDDDDDDDECQSIGHQQI